MGGGERHDQLRDREGDQCRADHPDFGRRLLLDEEARPDSVRPRGRRPRAADADVRVHGDADDGERVPARLAARDVRDRAGARAADARVAASGFRRDRARGDRPRPAAYAGARLSDGDRPRGGLRPARARPTASGFAYAFRPELRDLRAWRARLPLAQARDRIIADQRPRGLLVRRRDRLRPRGRGALVRLARRRAGSLGRLSPRGLCRSAALGCDPARVPADRCRPCVRRRRAGKLVLVRPPGRCVCVPVLGADRRAVHAVCRAAPL